MQLFALPTGVLATLLLSFIASTTGSPIPEGSDVPRYKCNTIPGIQTSYPEHQFVTSNPSNAAIDGKLVYVPTRIGIPENLPPVPLVIYSSTIPPYTNILKATLKGTALYVQSWSTPAKVADTGIKGLSAVYYQGGLDPIRRIGTTGAFHVTMGCDIKGKMRNELWPTEGRFCVRAGLKPELQLMIKSTGYIQRKQTHQPK